MTRLTLAGTTGLSWASHSALVRDGWRMSVGVAPVRVLMGAGVPLSQAASHRDFLLAGGRLLLCGGEGPLLARVHLMPLLDERVSGCTAGVLGEHDCPDVHPLRGIGEILLRVGDDCVALGGPRGHGFFCFLADLNPSPELLLRSLAWLQSQHALASSQ